MLLNAYKHFHTERHFLFDVFVAISGSASVLYLCDLVIFISIATSNMQNLNVLPNLGPKTIKATKILKHQLLSLK